MAWIKGVLQQVIDSGMAHDRKETAAAIACILAAIVLWFINALGEVHTTQLNYPVVFRYDSTRCQSNHPLPKHICIQVTGVGWQILKRQEIFNPDPVPILLPVRQLTLYPHAMNQDLSRGLPGLQVHVMQADTLYFSALR
jgi:hypothetical protein